LFVDRAVANVVDSSGGVLMYYYKLRDVFCVIYASLLGVILNIYMRFRPPTPRVGDWRGWVTWVAERDP